MVSLIGGISCGTMARRMTLNFQSLFENGVIIKLLLADEEVLTVRHENEWTKFWPLAAVTVGAQ